MGVVMELFNFLPEYRVRDWISMYVLVKIITRE
jgi:hypothetical protein